MINAYPTSSTQLLHVDGSIASLTAHQKSYILNAYAPYIVIPFIMMIDMGARLLSLVDKVAKMEKSQKTA